MYEDSEIDRRVLFGTPGSGWTVTAIIATDSGSNPVHDGDWATDADVAAWQDSRWQYVVVAAVVALDGVEIAEDTCAAVVHGDGPEGDDGKPTWTVDAFDMTQPGEVANNAVEMGSALNDCVTFAVGQAATWLRSRVGVEPSETTFAGVLDWNATVSTLATFGHGK